MPHIVTVNYGVAVVIYNIVSVIEIRLTVVGFVAVEIGFQVFVVIGCLHNNKVEVCAGNFYSACNLGVKSVEVGKIRIHSLGKDNVGIFFVDFRPRVIVGVNVGGS